MVEVGVKELKDSLSEYLRRVARGEHVRITLRGEPVADLLPAGRIDPDRGIRELAAQGRLTLPSRSHSLKPPPLQRVRRSASAEILAERESER